MSLARPTYALLSPFYGGSHQYWSDLYIRYSQYSWDTYTLPDKNWKWRMYGAAIHLAGQLNRSNKDYKGILTTDMLDAGLLKSLLDKQYRDLPLIVYFHENQLTYPWSPTDTDPDKGRDHHYGFVNYTSALVADRVVFNSQYHRSSFLKAARELLSMMPDYRSMSTIDEIEQKSEVVGIGIEIDAFSTRTEAPILPRVIWNHRWEYDKNPTLFFNTLIKLSGEGIPFDLVILGSATSKVPEIFQVAIKKLEKHIVHQGYIETKDDYYELLQSCTHLPVTSNQDFFGISAVEAIAAGCIPLLPQRLAFVEHLDPLEYPQYFHKNEDEFYQKLKAQLTQPQASMELNQRIKKYDWRSVAHRLDDVLKLVP